MSTPDFYTQYMFEIEWPTSYLSKGYSHFTLASQSLEEVREWHGAIKNVIDSMAGRHVMQSPSLYKESSVLATTHVSTWQGDRDP
jgi:hypothetical protein